MKPREARAIRQLKGTIEDLLDEVEALKEQGAKQTKAYNSLKGYIYRTINNPAPALHDEDEDEEDTVKENGAVSMQEWLSANG